MNINNEKELDAAIEQLEIKRKFQESELTEHFHATVDSFKPGNLIRNAVGKLGSSQVLGGVLKTAGSVGVGLLTTKLAGGALAAGGARGILSSLVKQSAAKAIFKNMDKIKAYGLSAYKNLFAKKQ